MADVMPFGEVIEAADQLSLTEKETLVEILSRRIIEERRNELAKDVEEANKEFQEGNAQPTTPDDLMKEITS